MLFCKSNEISNVMIKFKEKSLKKDIVKEFQTLNFPGMQKILSIAFKFNGYIAGGFALSNSQWALEETKTFNLGNTRSYILLTPSYIKNHPNWILHQGDIDLWFPNETCLNKFTNSIKELNKNIIFSIGKSTAGFADEYVVDNAFRIQVITHYLGSPTERLKTFDIFNAMVAITKDKIIIPGENWDEYEKNKCLHISNAPSSWTMNRLVKYVLRYDYQSLTPETTNYILAKLADNMKMMSSTSIKKWKKSFEFRKIRSQNIHHLMSRFGRILPMLSSEQLLLLASFTKGATNYSKAMNILTKRLLQDDKI